mmetsp:Transcript_6739/g.8808  ORF Transcript_6739/g.8808 Transcript_6739/m.8808 type:complete len:222 (-) Transcript_6739:1322-1987(-)
MRFSVPFLTLFALHSAAARELPFAEGDACNVQSSQFFDDSFQGEYLFAGDAGCTLGEKTGCYCAPDFDDETNLSGWKWQCNKSVKFGPVEGKVCPTTIPLAKDEISADILLSYRAGNIEDNPIACDLSIHPTGRQGDEACSYSTCDEGGDMSAICGCVDLAKYKLGEGQQWYCMQSTCSCGVDCGDGKKSSASVQSSASSQSKPLALAVAGLSALVFAMVH